MFTPGWSDVPPFPPVVTTLPRVSAFPTVSCHLYFFKPFLIFLLRQTVFLLKYTSFGQTFIMILNSHVCITFLPIAQLLVG